MSKPVRNRRTGPTTGSVVPFRGFARDALQFWHELAGAMSKEWYIANKQRYQAVWVDPLLTLLRQLRRELAPIYKPFELAEPGVLRIHRDLRFSKDKTPYKTHIAGVIRFAGDRVAEAGIAVLYFHLGLDERGADEEYTGVGCYQFDGDRTARWRQAVAGRPGITLGQIMGRLRDQGYSPGGYEHAARVPKGFAPDHPRADLLKCRGLICKFPEIPAGLLHRAQLADWLLSHAKTTAPLVLWLRRHLVSLKRAPRRFSDASPTR